LTGVHGEKRSTTPAGDCDWLSFRYQIDGSDEITIQIYSLSKGYHRYLISSGLPQKKWQTGQPWIRVGLRSQKPRFGMTTNPP